MREIKIDAEKVTPSKIVCIGRNYVEHIEELKNEIPSSMVIFNKPNSAITDTLYFIEKECHYEAEICFLIRDKKIYGVGCGLDLTKRDLQSKLKAKGLPWERAKAFNNSAVFTDFVEIKTKDIFELSLKLFINDNLTQHATIDLMIYKPDEILNEILSFMDLEDNDIIMTGTPKGVGSYYLGDEFIIQLYLRDKLLISKEWSV